MAAYGKHSSAEAVKTFIIITNLQALTKPGDAGAAKQALHLPSFHILAWCIRNLEGALFAEHTESYLLAHILLLCFSSTLRDGMMRVRVCLHVCTSLRLSRGEKQIICVCACLRSLTKHNKVNFDVLAHPTSLHVHVSLCLCVTGWERMGDCLLVRCVCGCADVMKGKPSLYTWDKHNSGNKSGQCCLVLS